MAFENSQAFNTESKRLEKTEQFENMAKVEVSLDNLVKKVVSVKGLARVVSLEKNGSNLTINGKTNYQVVYQTENNELCSVFADSDWQQKTENTSETPYVELCVMENVITGSSSTEIAISSLIKYEVYDIHSEKIEPVENLSEDYVVKYVDNEFYKVVNQVNQTINEVSEVEQTGKVSSVLNYTGDVRLKDVSSGIDSLTFEGEVLVCVDTLVDGNIVSINKVIEFKEEVSCLSALPNHLVDSELTLSGLKVTASVNETDIKTTIVIAVMLNASAVVYSKETKQVVVDAFSTEKNTETVTECVLSNCYVGKSQSMQSLVEILEISESVENIKFVTDKKAYITDVENNEENCFVKGNIEVKFVGQTENQEYKEYTAFLPFQVEVQNCSADDRFDVCLDIKNVKIKGQNEIEFSGDLYVNVKMYKKECITYVSSITETEPKEKSDAGIKVLVARQGEDLFAVSKALSLRPEVVLMQNPNLEEGIEPNTKIVVYSALDASF